MRKMFPVFCIVCCSLVYCNRDTRIFDAIRSNDIAQVRALLDENPKRINSRDNTGATPLHIAVNNQGGPFSENPHLIEMVEILLKYDADINAQDDNGNTPLFWACGWKNVRLISLLLEHGANPDIENKAGDNVKADVYKRVNSGSGWEEIHKLLINYKK